MSRAAVHGPASEAAGALREYRRISEQPLTMLLFITPLLLIYEIGIWNNPPGSRLIALDHLQRFFDLFGVTGRYLPPLTVAAILLAIHVLRRDPWQLEVTAAAAMAIESIMLGLPLLMVAAILQHYLHLAGGATRGDLAILSLGAGIYEELIFRLGGFALLSLLFENLLGIRRLRAGLLIVATSGLAFSAYHYLGDEAFSAQTFIFRTAAGVYFGGLFLLRGFGITAGAHAAYDLAVVALIPASNGS